MVDREQGPGLRWWSERVEQPTISLWSPGPSTTFDAIARGIAMGICPDYVARRRGLVQVLPGPDAWSMPIWVVTHRAMHRSARVRWVSGQLRGLVGEALQPQAEHEAS